MVESLLSLPQLVAAFIAMIVAAVAGVAVYIVSSKLISKRFNNDLIDPMANLFRLAALFVGLMLSFAFADVLSEKREIDRAIAREAVAIWDTYLNLQFFDAEEALEARTKLIEYVESVVADEWPRLESDQLSPRTGDLRGEITKHVLNLQPDTPAQEIVWSGILSDIDEISNHRMARLESALAGPPVFVYIVMIGFLVSMACFGVYRPQGTLIVTISLVSAFIGSMVYLVIALSDPYQGAFRVEPVVFENLFERLQNDEP